MNPSQTSSFFLNILRSYSAGKLIWMRISFSKSSKHNVFHSFSLLTDSTVELLPLFILYATVYTLMVTKAFLHSSADH